MGFSATASSEAATLAAVLTRHSFSTRRRCSAALYCCNKNSSSSPSLQVNKHYTPINQTISTWPTITIPSSFLIPFTSVKFFCLTMVLSMLKILFCFMGSVFGHDFVWVKIFPDQRHGWSWNYCNTSLIPCPCPSIRYF